MNHLYQEIQQFVRKQIFISDTTIINKVTKRKCVLDTDNGKALQEKVADLEQLLWAYQKGLITERIL